MNTTSFIGRLTKDPEVRSTTAGPVADLRVAVDGPNDRAVYVSVTVFGAQADAVAGNVAKGRQIGVTGRLAYDQWESESGELRSKLYVIATTVDFLARPRHDVPAEVTQRS
jgi:single-strand DNA-binding protein